MATWLALLRGVNVGGAHKLPMADVRSAVSDMGAEEVATSLQSGNVVFDHDERDAARLRVGLERAIGAVAGFDVPVILRRAREVDTVVRANPYDGVEPTHLHVLFFDAPPPRREIRALPLKRYAPEELVISGDEVYLHLPRGMGRAKLPAAIERLGATMTARNWRTVVKLHELVMGRIA